MRETLQIGEYYHIYNRGVDKREIFCDEKDLVRFLKSMREFNRVDSIGSLYELERRPTSFGDVGRLRTLVEFQAYVLCKNHYHFIIKQIRDGGISEFMKRLAGGYTKYFNEKYSRSGPLYQGKYKYIHVGSTDYLVKLSCYVHGNPEIHGFAKIDDWQWSSFFDYSEKRNGSLCNKNNVLRELESIREYRKLVSDLIIESRDIKDLLKYYLE